MFNQSTFGSGGGATGGFGSFGQPAAAAAPAFGSTGAFGAQPAAAPAFGSTGAFGSQPAAPATGGFGSTGGFGQTQPQQGGFGSTGGFGATATTGGFGQSAQQTQGAFGQPSTAGAFGQAASTQGAFGQPAQQQGGLFGGQQQQQTGFGGGFGANTQAQGATGTGNPVWSKSRGEKNDRGIYDYFNTITTMPQYASKSVEELRFEDYKLGRRPSGNGQPQQQQQPQTSTFGAAPTSGGLFGQTQPAAGGGMFGQSQPATGGGLFGAASTAATPTTGGLFGTQTNTNTFGQQQQQPAAGGGLFGGGGAQTSAFGQPAAAATGGLFGQTQPQQQQQQQGGLFGQQQSNTFGQQPQQGGSLFGAPAAPASGGGLFGSPAAAPTTSLFGQQPQQQQGGGLFGSPAAAPTTSLFGQQQQPQQQQQAFGQQPQQGGGLFGQQQQQQQQQGSLFGGNTQQSGGTSLFRATPPAPAGGSLFGQQPAAGGSLFGQQPAAGGSSLFGTSTAAPTSSLFGAPAGGGGTSLFGQPAQQQTGGSSLFGSTAPATGGSLFGQSAAPQTSMGLFGQQQQQQQQQQLGMTGGYGGYGQQMPSMPMGPPVPYAGGAMSQMVTHVALAQKAWKTVDGPEPPKGGGLRSRVTSKRLSSSDAGTGVSSGSGFPLDTVRIRPRGYGRGYGSLVSVQGQPGKDRVSRLADSASGSGTPASSRHVLSPGVFDLNKRLSINKARRVTPAVERVPVSGGGGGGDTPLRVGDAAPQSTVMDSTTKQLFLSRSPVSQPNDSPLVQPSDVPSGKKANSATKRRVNFAIDEDDNNDDEEQVPSASTNSGSEDQEETTSLMSDKCPTMSKEYVKQGYMVSPPLSKLAKFSEKELAHVEGFTVSRAGFGSVKWFGRVDVRGLIIHNVVEITELSVEVYKDSKDTPSRGTLLNRPALLTIEKLKVPSYFTGPPGTFSETLKNLNDEQDAEFVDYDEESAIWTFKVKHFTKYAFMPAPPPPAPVVDVVEMSMENGVDKDENERAVSEIDMMNVVAEPAPATNTSAQQQQHRQQPVSPVLTSRTPVRAGRQRGDATPGQQFRAGIQQRDRSAALSVSRFRSRTGQTPMPPPQSISRRNGSGTVNNMQNPVGQGGPLLSRFGAPTPTPGRRSRAAAGTPGTGGRAMMRNGSIGIGPSRLNLEQQIEEEVPRDHRMITSDYEYGRENSKNTDAMLFQHVPEEDSFTLRMYEAAVREAQRKTDMASQSVLSQSEPVRHRPLCLNRSFRVSFGPNGEMAHSGIPVNIATFNTAAPTSSNAPVALGRTVTIERVASRVSGERLEESLACHMMARVADNIRYTQDQDDMQDDNNETSEDEQRRDSWVSLVHQYATLSKQQHQHAKDMLGESPEQQQLLHAERVWGLFNALWGDTLPVAGADQANVSMLEVPSMDDISALVSQYSTATIGKTLRSIQGVEAHEAVVYDTVASMQMQERQSLMIGEALESVNIWMRQVLADMDGDREGLDEDGYNASAQQPGHELASGRIEEACEKAIEQGNFRLATLLAQATGDLDVRDLIVKQLNVWQEQGADRFIDSELLDAMRLLGGEVEQRHAAERHWLRGLALHLWHKNPALAPLTWATKSFREAVWTSSADDGGVVLPLPWHMPTQRSDIGMNIEGEGERFENEISTGPGLDTMYHLVRLASEHETYPLRKILEPAGHTNDVLDYSLSWHLHEILHCSTRSSPFGHGLTYNQRCLLNMSYAFQLESSPGMWPWAVYVVHQLDNEGDVDKGQACKKDAVIHLISRHCGSATEAQMDFVRDVVGVSEQWIAIAKAWHAKYIFNDLQHISQVIVGQQWSEFAELLSRRLGPKNVVDGQLEVFQELLDTARRNGFDSTLIADWDVEAGLYETHSQLKDLEAQIMNSARNGSINMSDLLESFSSGVEHLAKVLVDERVVNRFKRGGLTDGGDRQALVDVSQSIAEIGATVQAWTFRVAQLQKMTSGSSNHMDETRMAENMERLPNVAARLGTRQDTLRRLTAMHIASHA